MNFSWEFVTSFIRDNLYSLLNCIATKPHVNVTTWCQKFFLVTELRSCIVWDIVCQSIIFCFFQQHFISWMLPWVSCRRNLALFAILYIVSTHQIKHLGPFCLSLHEVVLVYLVISSYQGLLGQRSIQSLISDSRSRRKMSSPWLL